MPILRWFGFRFVTSRPSMRMVPDVGCSKPAIMRSVVVLPQPEGPRNDTNSPRPTVRLKSFTSGRAPEGLLKVDDVEEAHVGHLFRQRAAR